MKRRPESQKVINSSLFYTYNKFDQERLVQYICNRCRSLGIMNSLPIAKDSLSLVSLRAEWHESIRPETELLVSVFLENSEEKDTFIFSALIKANHAKVYSASNITLKVGNNLMLERAFALIKKATDRAPGGVYELI